jgi:hypothetical protein
LSFFSGDFAGGGVTSPGFAGPAGLGTEGCCDGAGAGGGGAGASFLSQPATVTVKAKRVTAGSDTIFFIIIHLLFNEILGTTDLEFNTRPRFCTYLI